MKELSNEEKRRRLFLCISFANEYELWREMARETLMTNLAPRIYCLSKQGYRGCGFHYNLEQELGKIIKCLAIGYSSINMNDFPRLGDIYSSIMINHVMFESLCEKVIEAENS